MTPLERVDQYLSNQLPADEVAELERDLQRDADWQALLNSVDMTRRTIRTEAIRGEVRRVHRAFIPIYRQQNRTDQPVDEPGARVMPLFGRAAVGWIGRIAATVLIAVAGYGGYQFITLDRRAVYDENFVAYQLPTTRDTDTPQSVLDSLYRAGNYPAVVQRLATVAPQPRPYFLAAMAYLQLGQYDAALAQFENLRAVNRRSDTPFFEQEADFYEALAQLGAGHYERAYAGLRRIYDDPQHMFHNNVSKTDLWKTKLLAYRGK